MIDTLPGAAVGNKKILVVEDDEAIGRVLVEALEDESYQVWLAGTGAEGERLLAEVQPDLLILDIMLPDADGLVFCAQLRPRSQVPIILLSASQRQADRVLGLKLGADDFVSKPFDIQELTARIEAVLRRAAPEAQRANGGQEHAQSLGMLMIDRSRRQASVGGRALDLTPTEFQILGLMASRPGEVFSRQELASTLWGERDMSHSRAIDVHIRLLRQKLEDVPQAPAISTVWGYGYKLDVEPPG